MNSHQTVSIKLALFSLITLGLVAAALYGQTPAPPQDKAPVVKAATKTPTISDTQKMRFFKAQAEAQSSSDQAKQAAQDAQQKQAGFQAVIKELQDACGKEFQPHMSKDGDPECMVNPVAEKVSEPKK